jgi:predicted AlkP superfamily pyrophosphatase or phosphodiesterase
MTPPASRSERRATVFIIMDAGRSDYVSPEAMPFAHALSRNALTSSFESPPGFAQRTVLFSGRYPDTSGNFSAFKFDPQQSPFAWVKGLGPLAGVVRPLKVMFPARLAIKGITKLKTGAYHTDPAWIPGRFLPFFRPCEDMRPIFDPGALGAASLFDLCRENGLAFRYLAHPVSGNDEEVFTTLVRELRGRAPYDLYVAQFSATDEKGHHYGPFSKEMQTGFLADLDRKLATIHAALTANYYEWDLFICGDHGMAPVERRLDILQHLKTAKAKPAKDYVVFVNSTLAVLWFLTDKGRREIEPLLASVPGARLVSEERRHALRIPMDRAWGDAMLSADPGVMFWPDYFHVKDSTIVGMHGYLDKIHETHGMGILVSSDGDRKARNVGLRPLVDVFPTLCDLVGVPTPPGQEGVSLLEPT